MALNVCAKGDYLLLSNIRKGEFSEAELYLRTSDDCDDEKLKLLPPHLMLVSVHQPTYIEKEDKLKLLDLTDKDVQEESIRAIQKTVHFLLRNKIPRLVLHCSSYNPYEDKRRAINELAEIVKPFLDEKIEISFETDMLGFNTYLPRRRLLTSKEDFQLLDDALEGRLLITIDIEHISGTSLFNLIAERFDLSRLNLQEYYGIYLNFIAKNETLIADTFHEQLTSFITAFRGKISHVHLNGSDFQKYMIDPVTTLPLLGEHLPLGYQDGEIKDRLDYKFIVEQLKRLPGEKRINIILELGIRKKKYDFHQEMHRSKLFLTNYLNDQDQEHGQNAQDKQNKKSSEGIKMHDLFEILASKSGPFIIADVGCNHGGSMELAKRLIDKAKEAGCDAVKFQSFTKDSLNSKNIYDSRKDIEFKDFGVKGLDKLHDKILFGDDEYRELKIYCDEIGIMFSSSAFAEKEADLLAELNVPFIKIASMELNNLDLLEYIAKKNIPIIISTGMGLMEEIETAIETIQNAGNNKILILHCIAMYPVRDYSIINLNKMQRLREKFNLPVGFSDHSLDNCVSIAATALGACVIEKHFMINKDDPFARERDFALDFETMKKLVQDCKIVYSALGDKDAEVSEKEQEMTKILRRSAVVRRDMKIGEIIKKEDIAFKRPGTGIPPTELNTIIGKKLNKEKAANELILREDLMGFEGA